MQDNMEEYWYWLSMRKEITSSQTEKLLKIFHTPRELFTAGKEKIRSIEFLTEQQQDEWMESKKNWDIEEEYHKGIQQGIGFISIDHPDYPGKLRQIKNPPYYMFYRGTLPSQDKMTVGIVGARRCSGYGKRMAEQIASALAVSGVQVISGMATGIDGFAQSAALRSGGKSFGVLGCGADICYPPQNQSLYEKLCREGGILSEYMPGSPPLSYHFPMRNRIISGLCDAVLIIEAKQKSGSLITADLALEQGREVYAMPGRIEDELSAGCNRLIAQGAGVITSVEELLTDLHILPVSCIKNKNKNIILETREELLYSCLDFSSKSLHAIIAESKMQAKEVSGLLLELELKGYIKEISKNYYVKI